MTIYHPFLKLKQNEILSLETLSLDTRSCIRPLFDVPRTSKKQNADEILERIRIGLEKMERLQEKAGPLPFYIDNFDLDDDLKINGQDQYRYILNTFKKFRAIPVVALDRSDAHNDAVFEYLNDVGGPVAVRLQLEDIDSWALARPKLRDLWNDIVAAEVPHIDVFIDVRVISDVKDVAETVSRFLKKFRSEFFTNSIIVTGSTIPSNISDLIDTSQYKTVPRLEYHLWMSLISDTLLKDVRFGDYGVVSPDYADIDLDPRIFRSISTPRAFYPFNDKMMVVRGSAFKTHPQGNGQYYGIADFIHRQPFFRGSAYSAGDKYIHDRSTSSPKRPPKAGSPGSWVKSTLASHITYIGNTVYR